MAAILDTVAEANAGGVLGIVSAFVLIYLFGILVFRLYFHPLSKFPGPHVAAVTRWYEFFHDVIKDGTYVKYYPVLHKKLGSHPYARGSENRI